MSVFDTIHFLLSLITLEPMVLVQGIAQYIIIIPQDQMILYKVCRGKVLRKINCSEGKCSITISLSLQTNKSKIYLLKLKTTL